MAETYAIVEAGGKQYRAEKGETLVVDRVREDEGAKVTLRAVMYRGGKDFVVEPDQLEKVKVEAVVAEHLRGPKVRIFKYKPKKGYRRRAGHRSELTKLEVTDVRLLQRKPAQKKETKAKAKAKQKAAAKKGSSSAKKGSSSQRKAKKDS